MIVDASPAVYVLGGHPRFTINPEVLLRVYILVGLSGDMMVDEVESKSQ